MVLRLPLACLICWTPVPGLFTARLPLPVVDTPVFGEGNAACDLGADSAGLPAFLAWIAFLAADTARAPFSPL